MVKFIGYKQARKIYRQLHIDFNLWRNGDVTLPTGAYIARDGRKRWVICGYQADGSDIAPYIKG